MISKLKFEHYSVDEVFQLLSENYELKKIELMKYIQSGTLQTNVCAEGIWNKIVNIGNKKLTNPIELVDSPAPGFITYSQNNVKVHSAIAANLENNFTIINIRKSDFFEERNLYPKQDVTSHRPDKQVYLTNNVINFKSLFKLPYQLFDITVINNNNLVIDFSLNELSQFKSNTNDDLYVCLSIDRSKLTAKNRILTLAIDNLIVIKDDLEYFIEHIIKKKHLKLKNNKNIQDSNLKIKNLKKENEKLNTENKIQIENNQKSNLKIQNLEKEIKELNAENKVLIENNQMSKLKIQNLEKEIEKSPTKEIKRFLKALIYIHFGAEVANSPRKQIFDDSSCSGKDDIIGKEFEKNGIKINITGKTLAEWINKTKLHFIEK